jgi:Rrf2 family transcriptional regulator, nitric oxide-sensitive transcriptional repressor
MQLTLYSDYSLRVLIFLGTRSPEETATISNIADAFGISRNHLVKVVHNLSLLGYIITARGKRGGMRLSRSPDKINLGEVVRQTEGSFDIVECFNIASNTCPISPICKLKGIIHEAYRSFIGVLDQYTLADILKNKKQLHTILSFKSVVQ